MYSFRSYSTAPSPLRTVCSWRAPGYKQIDVICWCIYVCPVDKYIRGRVVQVLASSGCSTPPKPQRRDNFAFITKTCLYNFDPLRPHFYIVILGFTGVYIIFLISAQNMDCGYSLEPPRWGGSNEYPQSIFLAEIWKISEFFIWNLSAFRDEMFNIFE